MRVAHLRGLLVVHWLLVLSSCAVNDTRNPFGGTGQVWPAPPEESRIAFVGEFSGPSDIGITTSFLGRLLDLAAGSRDEFMIRPMAVAATDAMDVLYVADSEKGCVHRYELQRGRYRCLTVAGRKYLIAPVGLAITEDGRLFVADSTNGKIYQAPPGGRGLEEFHTNAPVQRPTGIFWHGGTQQLYVTDTERQTVFVLDVAGNLVRTIGERGASPGKFNFPTYLWIGPRDELLVSDSLNFRIQRFSSDGDFIFTFGKNGDRAGDFSRPKGIATDSIGNIYVVDALMHAVQIFNFQGALLLSVGTQGSGEAQFWLPNGIFITPDNTIFVADTYNSRVQVFRYVGPSS